jgi:hypothetical protein
MREASVHTGRTRDTAHAAPGRLGNEHHCRDRRAHLDDKVRLGYHPGVGDATTAGRIEAPRPNHPVRKLSTGPYDGRRSRPGSKPRRRPSLARASASCADLQLGRPSQSLRLQLPGHIRAPWELLGSPKLPPAAGRIPAGLHPAIFEAAHRAA